MKFISKALYTCLMVSLVIFSSCNKSEDDDIGGDDETSTSMVRVMFENKVGTEDLVVDDTTATSYRFETSSGEKFNVNRFGYYITNIILEGPNGEKYVDPMNSSANGDEITGYYHVLESDVNSNPMLAEVPVGSYNKITFTVGVPESGVQEGAQGGILDLASGAWFWSWNAGYIGWLLEGQAETSTSNSPTNGFAFHVGGWKDVAAEEGKAVKFSNNTRTITLDFDDNLTVIEGMSPMVHLNCDILDVLDGVSVDFSSTNQLHTPASGSPFANTFSDAFSFDHVHLASH